MAQKPDGSAARTERVTFTRPAAERIANVVRTVEAGNRDSAGLTFQRVVGGDGAKQVRAATFTGAWSMGSAKVISFAYAPTATAIAKNLLWPLSDPNDAQQSCLVGREGTNWWLIAPRLSVISCDDKASGQQISTFLG